MNKDLIESYINKNKRSELEPLVAQLNPSNSLDCLVALLLWRDQKLGYLVTVPDGYSLDAWEEAIKLHSEQNKYNANELTLCLYFLTSLSRPDILGLLLQDYINKHLAFNSEITEAVLACFLTHQRFACARNAIALWEATTCFDPPRKERYLFLIQHAEGKSASIPVSEDKFTSFLRFKYGESLPSFQRP